MAKNANFVSHKKSKQKNQDGTPQLPLASALVEGEIAINFAENVETLSIKNESGDVVTFSCDNYYSEKKLGSGFTGENSANTVTSVVGSGFTSSSITDVIIENEEIVSAALTDLDERKLDVTAYTPTVELWVSGTGTNSVAQKGGDNVSSGNYSIAEGKSTSATSFTSHAEGSTSLASGGSSHAEGEGTSATSYGSHSEGGRTIAVGSYAHAEGESTIASGVCSHAEGSNTSATGEHSHAEGTNTIASGQSSHAEGIRTSATTNYSHAEGGYTLASGYSSHAECHETKAFGQYSHAEGYKTTASGIASHAEGHATITTNEAEHASGRFNISSSASTDFGHSGNTLFSVGNGTPQDRHNAFEIRQNGDIYIVSGNSDIKLQDYIGGGGGSITVDQVLDNTTSASTNPVSSKAVYDAVTDNELVWTNAYVTLSGVVSSHTENTEIHLTSTEKSNIDSLATNIAAISGITSTKVGNWDAAATSSHTHSNKSALDSITGNVGTMAYQNTNSYSSATQVNTALGGKSDTDTTYTKTEVDARDLWVSGTGTSSVAQKDGNNTASGKLSVAMGSGTTASGDYSVAEGRNTKASGSSSHAEGNGTTASSSSSHAEGYNTIASGSSSHAEGSYTTASGTISHAEGMSTTASGGESHAEGQNTTASGVSSHAEGSYTTANGDSSHAEGYYTTASGQSSHAEGYNTKANNQSEHASGQYNVSSKASSTFGDGGNTLFSVGNGSANDARHNAFEIRQNGDIYITSGNSDIKLQDYIGSVETVTAITPSNSGSTAPIATKVIAENELTVTNALNDLDERKLDASAYTPTDLSNYYTKSETSGATEISTALGGKSDTGHTHAIGDITNLQTTLDGKANTATTLAGYGITNAYTKSETSGATEISNALGGKVNSATYTGHTADTTIHFTTGTVQTQINNSISGKVDTSTFNTHTASTVHMSTTEKTNLDSLETNIKTISGITATDKLIHETLSRRTRKDFTASGMTYFVNTLKSAIADQCLEKYGMKVGDYCTATHDSKTYNYVIAGLNTMRGTLTPYCLLYNHVGIIVNTNITHAWNTSNTTSASTNTHSKNGTWTSGASAGYASCDLQYYLEHTILPNVKTDLGSDNIKRHSKLYSNAVNPNGYNRFGSASGCSSSSDWYASQEICALSEVQVYGSIVWSSSGYDTGEACRQLEVFRVYNMNEIFGTNYPWLRDVASSSKACGAGSTGAAYALSANVSYYVAALILFA